MTAALGSACKETVQNALSEILNEPTIAKECVDRTSFCNQLLTALKNHNLLAVTIAEVFAALGREEPYRNVAAECGVITALTPLLTSTLPQDVRLQALRAVGNLCFDNDLCRKQLLSSGGCPLLAKTVWECSTPVQEPLSDRMKCVACGCVLNVCNNNEELSKEMLDQKADSALIELLACEGEDEAVLQMALKALNALLNSDAVSLDSLVVSPLPKILSSLLCQSVDQDLFDGIHQVLDTLVENESWQVAIVDSHIAEQLLGIVNQELQKRALDIVVQLLLKNDMCMQKLFDAGYLLSRALEWLKSGDSLPEVKASAALVVGNLARSDKNCEALVQMGVVPLLMDLMQWKGDEETCCKVHTASLAALRNLSILESNRLPFLHCGVVDVAIGALHSPAATVQFNALGVLRLVSAKQAEICCYIANNSGTLAGLCELVGHSGFSHIQLEGGRLIASIVKHSGRAEVVKQVALCGGTKCIAVLLEAAPLIIKNEGVIALSLMAAVQDDQVTETFLSLDTLALVLPLLKDESPELVSNSLVLLTSLLTTSVVLGRKMKESDGYLAALEGLKGHANSEVAHKAQMLLHLIQVSGQ